MTTINDYLHGKRISRSDYADLKQVGNRPKLLDWFCYLHTWEIAGWRNKNINKLLTDVLSSQQPIQFYAMFCPSYKKGIDAHGFRTDDVGETSKTGIQRLQEITDHTRSLGFVCRQPLAIFFDLALEQPEKAIHELDNLQTNIANLKKYTPESIEFSVLSELFPVLKNIIGYQGIEISPLPVSEKVLKRIVERGEKFYHLFGWSKDQIVKRSRVIISSETVVGHVLRHELPNAIMVYTPTMLERSQLYKDIPLIFPKIKGS